MNNPCRISPDWILKKFGWEQIHPMFTRMKNVSGRKEKKCWLRKVRKCGWEREMDPCEYPPVPFQSTAGAPRDPALKCSAAQIKNATNSNSFAPWTLERTNKPTDHWIWKHWNALKRTVNQELHDIQMQQTLLLPHAKKTFDLLPHHICLNITLKPIRNLYLLFSLRRGHWWISNLSSKISPKPAFSAGFKDRQGQRLHNALWHRVLWLLLLQRGQWGAQTCTGTPSRHADHAAEGVKCRLFVKFDLIVQHTRKRCSAREP